MIPDFSNFLIFLAATVTLNITPGPDMMFVTAQSLGKGSRAGVISSLGIGTGCLIHTFTAAFGLSAVLSTSPLAFTVIKYLGAVYLIYLGIKTLMNNSSLQLTEHSCTDLGAIFRQGVITNVFNPKVALFFLAFLPQFADSSKGSVAMQILFLGIVFVVSGSIVNTAVAFLAGTFREFINNRPWVSRYQNMFSGVVFVTLGVRLALSRR